MKIKDFIENIVSKIKNFILKNRKSYLFYILAIFFFISGLFLILFKINIFAYSLFVFTLFLFVLGFLIDTYFIIKKFWKYVLIIISVTTIFYVYPNSQILAKTLVYEITKENPDFFQNSVNFFANFYAIISWIKFLFFTLPWIFFGFVLIMYILMFFDILFPKLSICIKNKILSQLNLKKSHLIFYGIGFAFFITFYFMISPFLLKIIDENLHKYSKKLVLKFSYYPNIICNNIPKGTYIKLINVNMVSVSNVNFYSSFLYENFHNKISFEHKLCKRKIK